MDEYRAEVYENGVLVRTVPVAGPLRVNPALHALRNRIAELETHQEVIASATEALLIPTTTNAAKQAALIRIRGVLDRLKGRVS